MDAINHYIKNSKILYYCKTDLEGNYIYVSPYFEEVFDCKSVDMMGVNSLETIFPDDRQKVIDISIKCFQNPKTYQQITLRKPSKDGTIIWSQWEFYLDTDENDQPKEIICYGYDLTESVKTNDLLQKTKLELDFDYIKYQTLFETPSVAIILHNELGDIYEANQYFCDLVGIKKEDVNKYNFKKFIPEKDWAREKSLMDQLIKTGNSISYEKEFINKNGNLTPIAVNKRLFYDIEKNPFIWCLAIDISEKEKQKELLNKQKELLEQTDHIAKLGGWEINIETFKTEWTKEVYDIHELEYGYNHNLDNGISYYHPDDREIISNAVNKTINEGLRFDLELRFISAKNTHKWLRVIGEPVYKDNKIISVKGVLQDISQRKQSEEIITKQNNLLKDISFTQSHLVRLPIANILGLIDLADLENSAEEKNEIYQKIKHSVNQLDLILREVANKKITD